MTKFEAVLLLSPELPNQALLSEISKFKNQISENSGKIIDEENSNF